MNLPPTLVGPTNHANDLPPQVLSPIPVNIKWFALQWTSSGKVNPWLGPALRGMSLYSLRRSSCLLGEDGFSEILRATDSRTDPRRCRNCGQMKSCLYGQAMEPDLKVLDRPFHQGNRDGMRGVTFGAALQRELNVTVGEQSHVRILSLGPWADAIMPSVLKTLERLGKRRGLGPDHVRFRLSEIENAGERYSLKAGDLPAITDLNPPTIPRLKITLDSPLVAATKWGKRPPEFRQIAMAAIQTVSRAVRQFSDDSFADIDFGRLKSAAGEVESVACDWQSEKYSRSSSRQEVRWNMHSWLGTGVYKNVPAAFLPWLQWGGILGVGDSRNCGAGLWTIQL